MSDAPEAVMLFAAGFGTRMGELTKQCPKPLIGVAGRPLIDHALDLARAVAPARIVANTHYLPEMLAAHLRPRGVILSPEQPDILDTGGGLRAALPMLGPGPVYTMNTDAIWSGPNPMEMLRDAWEPQRMAGLLMCIPPEAALGYSGGGDFTLGADGRLARRGDLIYGGVQILRTEDLHDVAESSFSLNRIWDRMIGRGRLFALRYPGRWCDVGTPEGITLAEGLIGGGDV